MTQFWFLHGSEALALPQPPAPTPSDTNYGTMSTIITWTNADLLQSNDNKKLDKFKRCI